MTTLAGLAPVINTQTRILILGSFPGTASLAASEYYAHPRNQFWHFMSVLLEHDLMAVTYTTRLAILQNKHIGLWDVIASCERLGSLDSAIRDACSNQLSDLSVGCPNLKRIGFNGKTAGKFAMQFAGTGIDTIVLPSSSPAYASMRFAEKLTEWRKLFE